MNCRVASPHPTQFSATCRRLLFCACRGDALCKQTSRRLRRQRFHMLAGSEGKAHLRSSLGTTVSSCDWRTPDSFSPVSTMTMLHLVGSGTSTTSAFFRYNLQRSRTISLKYTATQADVVHNQTQDALETCFARFAGLRGHQSVAY